MQTSKLGRVGLGFRREMLDDFLIAPPHIAQFFEVAPENWLKMGGKYGRQFKQLTEQYAFICHGLSLSLGSPAPLDVAFIKSLKAFFKEHNILLYSEHLSYCSGEGHMYDLMPIPFTEEAVTHVARRISQVQDILERRIAVENVSYYAAPGQEMSEQAFTLAVLEQADCDLLLDVNNIYVNSINHGYDAEAFLKAMPSERIAYGHVAGHYEEAEDLLVDTHGAPVCDPVWQLLEKAYHYHGVFPTLLERDFNIPCMTDLENELQHIEGIQKQHHQHKKGVA
ncbi:DUF692 domain-containing protein [Pseudoalteromonas sp. JBTF-M23]|uniref:UPF0276 protein HG263_03560 n=1 Tax=Pseudoalteromonas caenipelagi TaxID=2726988 RepID=A0A849V7T9_9GAMM|nr:DUF692 domain-containing protein [Pseudoalteromonas caenipelagi]NOU49619.1 DUF692 domain-containing protein [Pseudoalteromonas caenipelagi]